MHKLRAAHLKAASSRKTVPWHSLQWRLSFAQAFRLDSAGCHPLHWKSCMWPLAMDNKVALDKMLRDEERNPENICIVDARSYCLVVLKYQRFEKLQCMPWWCTQMLIVEHQRTQKHLIWFGSILQSASQWQAVSGLLIILGSSVSAYQF